VNEVIKNESQVHKLTYHVKSLSVFTSITN